MKKKLLVLLFSLATLGLVSCGGGNDVASSGASAVSAAAPVNSPDASTTSTPLSTPSTEPKVSGQANDQSRVAPVAAQARVWTPYGTSGCAQSSSFCGYGPALTSQQYAACIVELAVDTSMSYSAQCQWAGGEWTYVNSVTGSYYCNVSCSNKALWSPYANGGCVQSSSFGGSGPALTSQQYAACVGEVAGQGDNPDACLLLGGSQTCGSNSCEICPGTQPN